MVKNFIFIENQKVFTDNRGIFFESYKKSDFLKKYNFNELFVQDNHSISKKNVIRGMHYQWNPPMGKLVRVVKGEVLDVIVDIRKSSPNYGKVYSFLLSEQNKNQLYVPPGYAHGFVSRAEESVVLYKCTSEYNSDGESGINPLDTHLSIDWGIERDKMIISQKDLISKSFKEYDDDKSTPDW